MIKKEPKLSKKYSASLTDQTKTAPQPRENRNKKRELCLQLPLENQIKYNV